MGYAGPVGVRLPPPHKGCAVLGAVLRVPESHRDVWCGGEPHEPYVGWVLGVCSSPPPPHKPTGLYGAGWGGLQVPEPHKVVWGGGLQLLPPHEVVWCWR